MSKFVVLYDRMLTAKFLNDNAQWNCAHNLVDNMHLSISSDSIDYERIFKYKLVDRLGHNVEDLEVDLEVGAEYTGTNARKDPISFTVSGGDWAMGIQCRDLTEYGRLGPYLGVEGQAGRVLNNYALLEQNQERSVTGARWPRIFNIRIKPLEKVAVCHTAIDRGHLLTVVYDEYNPTIDIARDDLYLDVYRLDDQEIYTINYIKVRVTAYVPFKE